MESVQKCENVGCVVWSKDVMTVEDTMRVGNGSAHCDVPTKLARNMCNSSVAKEVSSSSSTLLG